VRRNVAGLIVVFVGAAVLQLAISDTYLRYVKPGMRWMLLLAGAILILLAVADVLADTKKQQAEVDDHDVHTPEVADEGHHHHGLPRAAWLLLVPVFALLVVDPPALGADAAQRQSPVAARPVNPQGQGVRLPGNDNTATPVALPVRDYAVWAVWEKESMRGRTFQLTGFVTPGREGRWYVSRIGLTCCVADGTAFLVEVHGQPAPPKNQWVQVVGAWREPTKQKDGEVAAIDGTSVRTVTAPANQYE
jgi:uncharacterized repeat protein (TIGR03943 family)